MQQRVWAPAATLYLSGGGLGARADAWPEALDWLAARVGGVAFASLASNDTTQARTLQALLAARGERAEVLSADAYAAFEETAAADGTPSVETGTKYRQAILEAGGSRPAMESFKAFRGREPSLDALLRHQGMSA